MRLEGLWVGEGQGNQAQRSASVGQWDLDTLVRIWKPLPRPGRTPWVGMVK